MIVNLRGETSEFFAFVSFILWDVEVGVVMLVRVMRGGGWRGIEVFVALVFCWVSRCGIWLFFTFGGFLRDNESGVWLKPIKLFTCQVHCISLGLWCWKHFAAIPGPCEGFWCLWLDGSELRVCLGCHWSGLVGVWGGAFELELGGSNCVGNKIHFFYFYSIKRVVGGRGRGRRGEWVFIDWFFGSVAWGWIILGKEWSRIWVIWRCGRDDVCGTLPYQNFGGFWCWWVTQSLLVPSSTHFWEYPTNEMRKMSNSIGKEEELLLLRPRQFPSPATLRKWHTNAASQNNARDESKFTTFFFNFFYCLLQVSLGIGMLEYLQSLWFAWVGFFVVYWEVTLGVEEMAVSPLPSLLVVVLVHLGMLVQVCSKFIHMLQFFYQ